MGEVLPGTRWAYIGLSHIDILEGNLDKSLETNATGVRVMQNTEGPAIYVYRGEAKRLLGRIDEALPELEKAAKWHPARASATINLILAWAAKHEQAPDPDLLDKIEPLWLRLRDEQAAGLMSDAAREIGISLFGDPDDPELPLADKVKVLDRALAMMGGNHSSGCLTYYTNDGRLRFVQQWPHRGRGPHARDAQHLSQAKRILLKALATYNGPRSV